VFFDISTQSHTLWAVDRTEKASYALPLNPNSSFYSTLSLINTQSTQVGDYLYITGGFGWSNDFQNEVSWPTVTVINVPNAIQAIRNGNWEAFASNTTVQQLTSGSVQVTGWSPDFRLSKLTESKLTRFL
jgi:hypothetical protein